MSFSQAIETARKAQEAARSLGFDRITVSAVASAVQGVRVAQSTICRENVAKSDLLLDVSGSAGGRESGFTLPSCSESELMTRIRTLRADIELQTPDKEHVLPVLPKGSVTWKGATAGIQEQFGPDILYPLIAKHAARARGEGLRLTGYFEAKETERHSFATGFDLKTHDSGLTMSITIDDAATGAVGATQRAVVRATPQALDLLIGEALDEAMTTCKTSARPGELAPGDYTVVLHPLATLDLIQTTLNYGMFDRRKIDESRTYLTKAQGELAFPEGMTLEQTLTLPLGPEGGLYADSPFNERMVPCATLSLIQNQRITDLHTSAYWAQKTGVPETFASWYAPPLRLSASRGPLAGKHQTLRDLIADTERGVYVANMWYLRMVTEMDGVLTGMTRDGVFEIKDGKLVRPLINMRWHDNPFQVLARTTGVTTGALTFGMPRLAGMARSALARMPALRSDGFHFSSATKF